jgi:4-amino-4-deoxy-L-arabinose transferase-like glycosyltransferase
MQARRWTEALWFLAWACASSVWCLTAAHQLGPTFDEPLYVERGLDGWRHFSHRGLLTVGTMPLPIDVQTLPLYVWEQTADTPLDAANDLQTLLPVARAGNLLFWWLLLWYARLTGRLLAGPWGGRLAVAFLACEPNLLAHASLATTDIAITAGLLALLYHFRTGRDADWRWRLAVPAVCFGLAILAKASALVYGPICLVVVELERLARSDALATPTGTSLAARLAHAWRQTAAARRDLTWIGLGGVTLAFVYCGTDFQPQPGFVAWAHKLPDGAFASSMVWLAENLCVFSNAGEGLVRQIKHNMHGHGTYLLGESHPRALWYYFPVLLTIKLSLPLLFAPVAVAAVRTRALVNWACLAALVLLVASLNFRVQIGIRLVLPMVALAGIGVAAAAVEALGQPRWTWLRPALTGSLAFGLAWTSAVAARAWPHGLCYINELWGGQRGYELVSDSNYDWGQGLPELAAWQSEHGPEPMCVWYFGSDPAFKRLPVENVPLHVLPVERPEDVVSHARHRYLAVSTTLLYGSATNLAAHQNAAAFLRGCTPAGRTSTFLIYERQALVEACRSQRVTVRRP